MNHNRTPDMGMSIYMNGCSCGCLWDEVQANETREAEVHTAETEERTHTRDDDDCQPQCNFEGWKLAMAYVPMQPWEEPFDLDRGLRAGTIFPGLRLPFRGGGR